MAADRFTLLEWKQAIERNCGVVRGPLVPYEGFLAELKAELDAIRKELEDAHG